MTEPLLPVVGDDATPFWEGCRQGVLRVQRCAESGRLIFPPRATSPFAPRVAPEWIEVSGRGILWSFVVPHPPLLAQFAALAPYNVVAVALEEDPSIRLIGNLLAREGGAIDEVDPATIEIGAPVRVVFDAVTEEFHFPRWVLTS
jgi:uncharacterized OB-fold protein